MEDICLQKLKSNFTEKICDNLSKCQKISIFVLQVLVDIFAHIPRWYTKNIIAMGLELGFNSFQPNSTENERILSIIVTALLFLIIGIEVARHGEFMGIRG